MIMPMTPIKPTRRQRQIALIIARHYPIASSALHEKLGENAPSLITVKRDLAELVKNGYISLAGKGRGAHYSLTPRQALLLPINADTYCQMDVDKRGGRTSYNFDLMSDLPASLFSSAEREWLDEKTKYYRRQAQSMSDILHKKELERFIIELSWKSSRIEGNTYSLLDTQLLLEKGIEAEGHTLGEAIMILNHKKAFHYILSNKDLFTQNIRLTHIADIHELLVRGLNVQRGHRNAPVGVTGSSYTPLDNEFQIGEALQTLINKVNDMSEPYSRALLLLAGISYIQPFEDGNKRTARLMANAILIAHKLAPLSYRNVEEKEYRKAVLTFYELNSIAPLKDIFIDQYNFAADTYRLG